MCIRDSYWGNELNIDTRRIVWRRVLDMNDRALRHNTVSLGGISNGYPRESWYDITVASEIMAILALTDSYEDLRLRLGNIVVGWKKDKTPVLAKEIKSNESSLKKLNL